MSDHTNADAEQQELSERFDDMVIDVQSDVDYICAEDEKMRSYTKDLPKMSSGITMQYDMAVMDLVSTILAEKLDTGGQKVLPLEQSQQQLRSFYEQQGAGAHASKLLVQRTEELVRDTFRDICPMLHDGLVR